MIKLKDLLNENPDAVRIKDGKLFKHSDADAIAFGMYKNRMRLSEPPACRSDVLGMHIHSRIHYLYDDMIDTDTNDRLDFKFPGRLWVEEKVISFWTYPKDKGELKSICNQINEELSIRHNNDPGCRYYDSKIDNNWKIEIVIDRNGKWCKDMKNGEYINSYVRAVEDIEEILIPISQYNYSKDRTEDELNITHILTPIQKMIQKMDPEDKMKMFKKIDIKKNPSYYSGDDKAFLQRLKRAGKNYDIGNNITLIPLSEVVIQKI